MKGVITVQITDEQIERIKRGETVELVPPRKGFQIRVIDFDPLEGVAKFDYVQVETDERADNEPNPITP